MTWGGQVSPSTDAVKNDPNAGLLQSGRELHVGVGGAAFPHVAEPPDYEKRNISAYCEYDCVSELTSGRGAF